jgi:hypothetical protein
MVVDLLACLDAFFDLIEAPGIALTKHGFA